MPLLAPLPFSSGAGHMFMGVFEVVRAQWMMEQRGRVEASGLSK